MRAALCWQHTLDHETEVTCCVLIQNMYRLSPSFSSQLQGQAVGSAGCDFRPGGHAGVGRQGDRCWVVEKLEVERMERRIKKMDKAIPVGRNGKQAVGSFGYWLRCAPGSQAGRQARNTVGKNRDPGMNPLLAKSLEKSREWKVRGLWRSTRDHRQASMSRLSQSWGAMKCGVKEGEWKHEGARKE